MEQTKYDVFISYRRKGGSEKAQLVKSEIKQRGIEEERIFLDTHSLHDGDFEEKIKVAIGQSRSVVVIISKGCFDEVKETDFWYMEIREALLQKKKVVPIFFDGITSFNALDVPVELKELVKKNAVTYQHEYADAAFDKLLTFIDCNPLQPNNKRKGCLFSMKYRGCLISVTLLSILFLVVFPIVLSTDEDNNDMIAYNTPQESDIVNASPDSTYKCDVGRSKPPYPVAASKYPENAKEKDKKSGFVLRKAKDEYLIQISYPAGKITMDCQVVVIPYVVDCETEERILTLNKIVYKKAGVRVDNNQVFRIDTVVSYPLIKQKVRVDYDVVVSNEKGVLFVDKYKGSK